MCNLQLEFLEKTSKKNCKYLNVWRRRKSSCKIFHNFFFLNNKIEKSTKSKNISVQIQLKLFKKSNIIFLLIGFKEKPKTRHGSCIPNGTINHWRNYKILKNQLKSVWVWYFCPGNVFLYNHKCDSQKNKNNKNKWGKFLFYF